MKWRSLWSRRMDKDGEIRLCTSFILFPMCVNNEWRWLERATVEYRFDVAFGWLAYRWVDK